MELELWRTKWKDSELAEGLNTPMKALPHVDKDYFPNIHTLMLIMATIPITSCECERSFSLLRLVKSTSRTAMTEDRLNGLALMQDIKLDPDDIVEEFAILEEWKCRARVATPILAFAKYNFYPCRHTVMIYKAENAPESTLLVLKITFFSGGACPQTPLANPPFFNSCIRLCTQSQVSRVFIGLVLLTYGCTRGVQSRYQ